MRALSLFVIASSGASIAACGVAHAVIVGPGDGTQNTLPGQPPPVAGAANVGSYLRDGDNAPVSAIYLGNQYVLLPVHGQKPNTSGITFPTVGTFQLDSSINIPLLNTDNSAADLRLGRLTMDPGLPVLNLATSSPTIGTSITMVGFGANRATTPTYYNVTGNSTIGFTWTETADSANANAGGFKYAAGNTLRWGTNTADGDGGTTNKTFHQGITEVFQTDFYEGGSFAAKQDFLAEQLLPTPPQEAEGAPGDSGGGVFDSTNHLVGMMDAIGTFTDQPGNTAVFGNVTYIADIATYQSQITPLIPEPAATLFLPAGLTMLGLLRRKRAT